MNCRWLVLFIALLPTGIKADGILIPPIAVKYHRVTMDIDNQVAATHVDQVFFNDTDMDSLEGTYIFPLPEDACISSFSMWVDGEELTAEILNADSARAIYESIVRRRLDPALLEYLGRGMFQARVFPIRTQDEKRIQLSYSELLAYDSGVCRYLYPLSTEKFSTTPLEEVSVTVNLTSSLPIKTIYSPSHPIVVQKEDDYSATITYFEENVKPETDFILYYTVSTEDIGMNLLTHRMTGADGFYLLMAAPKQDWEESDVVKKRIVFVLDRSGSMSGGKIEQAKEALRFCITNLNSDDVFNIVDFASMVSQFRPNPVTATASDVSAAVDYIAYLAATGGTNLNDALLVALNQMSDDSFTNMVVFLTDGQPTVGVTDNEQIQSNVREANVHNARLFVFGVGYNVNTHLLDNLSGQNRGVSVYVRPEENIEVIVSSFFSKINNPVLSNLSIDFGSIITTDMYPVELPDLFEGSQMIQFGRYTNYGGTTVVLSGDVNGLEHNYTYEATFTQEDERSEFIPRLWAIRKVGYLLDQIRLHGESQELIDEIVALSKKYGIITPYTSFLILEDEAPAGAWDGLSEETGWYSFDAATNIGDYSRAEHGHGVKSSEIKYAGNKVFFMRDGFWTDSEYTSGSPTKDVEFLSPEYFALLEESPELGRCFAVGKNVIVVFEGVNYRVCNESSASQTVPVTFGLEQNYPNPFNSETFIRYEVLSQGALETEVSVPVTLDIFNILGQKVRTVVNENQENGQHVAVWDGNDYYGRRVSSGIYFYTLSVKGGQWSQIRRMVLLR